MKLDANARARLRADSFDLLVVGGGITGAGTALDAATRGMRVALVEKSDYASGTSSRSSKLLHGGLRYLQHLEVGLVREALTERGILQRIAPHLVTPTPFLVPKIGRRKLLPIAAGLQAYDALAIGSGFPRHRHLPSATARLFGPGLTQDLTGAMLYWDARTDDARLVWTVARTAIEHGAVLANYVRVNDLTRDVRGRVDGAEVTDLTTGDEFRISARSVVNAAGVWADDLRQMEDAKGAAGIRPSKGVHLTFPASAVDVRSAMLIPAPDGRYVFVIPWVDDTIIVGTTDDDFTGDVNNPRADSRDIDYLMGVLNHVMDTPVDRSSILAAWAGLRPLIQKPGQSTKDLSRRHKVLIGEAGVVTITGGKMTTYRPMAADAVDAALEAGGFNQRPASVTSQVHLSGGLTPPGLLELLEEQVAKFELDPTHGRRLFSRYGARAPEVIDVIAESPELGEQLHPQLPYLKAEAVYAITHEGSVAVDDVLSHRLRARITSADRGLSAVDFVASRLASAHNWTPERTARETNSYRESAEADVAAESS